MKIKPVENGRRVAADSRRNNILSLLTLPLSFLLWEITARFYMFGLAIDRGLLFVPAIGLVVGAIFTISSLFFGKKGRKVFTGIVLGVGGFYYSFYPLYYAILHSIFSWHSLSLANAVTEFWSVMLAGIIANFYMAVTAFLPLILFLIFKNRYFCLPARFGVQHGVTSVTAAMLAVALVLGVAFVPENRNTFLYMRNDVAKTFRYYGVLCAGSIELTQMFFGSPEEEVENPYENTGSNTGNTDNVEEIEYGENTLNIDFEALISGAPNNTIRDMHEYFASVPATDKNEYTGMFEGKNLIFLSLEGFSYKIIDPELTPTLYKMYSEGFQFTEFYDIMWGGSTASGEYSNMTGNFYTAATCLKQSADTLQYSSLGNLFKNTGYDTFAYHNHTYTYYGRHKSHPNFGYDVYKGIGNGLNIKSQWPRSDHEMALATIDEYINNDGPFHTYYMTVSGHNGYTWVDNSMSAKHKNDIPADMPYSERIKAYFACQLEVELMLKELMDKLEAAGKLEDTVFAMCTDHYPYALSDTELAELYGLPVENIRTNFDLYRNAFILWSPSMEEPVMIDTPCTSFDIVPTLANLFGIDYESKVITGKDILSDTENIAIINDDGKGSSWNWITAKGRYNTAAKSFQPANGVSMTAEETEEYIRITNMKVAAMRKYSLAILDHNYYSYIFNADGTPKAVKN